jgi:hypothetical protein
MPVFALLQFIPKKYEHCPYGCVADWFFNRLHTIFKRFFTVMWSGLCVKVLAKNQAKVAKTAVKPLR